MGQKQLHPLPEISARCIWTSTSPFPSHARVQPSRDSSFSSGERWIQVLWSRLGCLCRVGVSTHRCTHANTQGEAHTLYLSLTCLTKLKPAWEKLKEKERTMGHKFKSKSWGTSRMGEERKSKKGKVVYLFVNSIYHLQVWPTRGLGNEILGIISVTWSSNSHHGNLLHQPTWLENSKCPDPRYQFTWYRTLSPSH